MKLSFTAACSPWAPRSAVGFPDGAILFDGVCIFCSAWVQFVVRPDEARRFRFIRIQTPLGRRLAAELGIDPDSPQTNAVSIDGVVLFKSDAALAVACRLRGLAWMRVLTIVPQGLRDWFYDRAACNRYAVFGKSETCLRPTPELAARLLDRDEAAAS